MTRSAISFSAFFIQTGDGGVDFAGNHHAVMSDQAFCGEICLRIISQVVVEVLSEIRSVSLLE